MTMVKLPPSLHAQYTLASDPSAPVDEVRALFEARDRVALSVRRLLLRNPALPESCMAEALDHDESEIAHNPALDLYLVAHPDARLHLERMLVHALSPLVASCPAAPGLGILREWAFAASLAIESGPGNDDEDEDPPPPPDIEAMYRVCEPEESAWGELLEASDEWLDDVCDVASSLAAAHPDPTTAALALAVLLRPLPRREIDEGSPAQIDALFERLDELLGQPRLDGVAWAPPASPQLGLFAA